MLNFWRFDRMHCLDFESDLRLTSFDLLEKPKTGGLFLRKLSTFQYSRETTSVVINHQLRSFKLSARSNYLGDWCKMFFLNTKNSHFLSFQSFWERGSVKFLLGMGPRKYFAHPELSLVIYCFLYLMEWLTGWSGILHLKTDAWVSGSDKVEKFIAVFAHEWLQMMASDVVPLDAILVEVIQDSKTGLVVTLGETMRSRV